MKKMTILLILITCITMTGCQKNNSGENNANASSETTQDASTENNYKLNSDLYDFNVLINDKQYTLPFDFKELSADNWQITKKDGDSSKLAVGESKSGYEITNGQAKMNVNLLNLTESETELAGCSIGAIEFTREDAASGVKLELTKNITIDSTKDEIIAAYGEPTKIAESDSSSTLYYKMGIEEYVEFDIDSSDNKVSTIRIENYSKNPTSNSQSTDSADSTDTSEYPVKELGDDLFSKNFELDGVVYTLPVSMDEMSKNGWSVKYDKEEYIEPNKMASVKLRKGNYIISTIGENTTSEKIKLEDAPVRYIKVNKSETDISIKLPKNITIGMTKDELDAALNGYEFKTKDSSNSKIEYALNKDGYEITISVDKTTNCVKEIIIAVYTKTAS